MYCSRTTHICDRQYRFVWLPRATIPGGLVAKTLRVSLWRLEINESSVPFLGNLRGGGGVVVVPELVTRRANGDSGHPSGNCAHDDVEFYCRYIIWFSHSAA